MQGPAKGQILLRTLGTWREWLLSKTRDKLKCLQVRLASLLLFAFFNQQPDMNVEYAIFFFTHSSYNMGINLGFSFIKHLYITPLQLTT